ncbi:hypothetical protein [Actinoalloteichus hymeniacidonis]|uniref:Uncharacterized protein n=1 Tax=Actinoalloteichus hymeniacidonis TaxID=340345 RepID=A0AAC9HRQ9_9PSEU|nr:hypothetical protein [Actinoalloteichus hymeniacidonis]AOS64180.1 hypothetical protein TL08_16900 [Actinoalloteichus hymeniacidonis]MBB5907752.1 hypothetical protein [Actinoalloteichus hymeniacidonis]
MTGHWFVRTVGDGDTHRAADEHWTSGGQARIRPRCDVTSVFTALNSQPIGMPFYDSQRCPDCLNDALLPIRRAARGRRPGPLPRPRHLAVVRSNGKAINQLVPVGGLRRLPAARIRRYLDDPRVRR